MAGNRKVSNETAVRTSDDIATRGELIIAAAINSVDFSEYKSIPVLENAVLKRISTITQTFYNPSSTAMRMLDAIKIRATITDIEYEESSTRFVITFVSENSDDGHEETIRSDRTDRFDGDRVRHMWSKDLIGKKVVIYKTMEETGNPKKPTCRVAPYVSVIG